LKHWLTVFLQLIALSLAFMTGFCASKDPQGTPVLAFLTLMAGFAAIAAAHMFATDQL
jgi:hypothetical protein